MLELHAADRAETLVDHLVDVLAVPPADPFERDWVAVPSIGMRRWLSQQLSTRLGAGPGRADGISANIHLPFPAELRQLVLDEVLPGEVPQPAGADRWQTDRLVWAVLEVLHDAAADPLLAPLAEVPAGATLLGRAKRLADLLDRYAVHRPGLIQAWAKGYDVSPAGERLGDDLRWQPHLFRMVRARVGQPSPPERLPDLLAAIADGTLALEPRLPGRIALFGLTTMPPDLGPLLEALAVRRDVRVLSLSLSPELTRATMSAAASMAPAGDDDGGRSWSFPRRSDPTLDVARHPLLRSWAQPNRELAAQLGVAGQVVSGLDRPPPEASAADRSLLARLQADVRANRAPDGGHRLDPDDCSIQVHACSGSTRQVEALRDAICGLLAADPTLTEGDIAVLSPDLEHFVPFVESVFGPSASADSPPYRPGGPPSLRYRVTDRSVRDRNPILGALDVLLGLVASRCTASAVTELLSLEPVRRRFGLMADDLSLLDRWIGDTHIRWGLDGPHRAAWGLPAEFSANTWQAGLDQLLMGVAVSESAGVLGPGEVAPMLVEGSDVIVAGKVAHAVRTIGALADALNSPRPIASWCDDLADAADLLSAVPFDGVWQRRRLDAVLDGLRRQAAPPGAEPPAMALTLADVRRLLRDHLAGEPARAAFG
ncbi:MAG: exodeoxyribonuclease V subunit gamma, partial [Acidimicrobiales bacterium]